MNDKRGNPIEIAAAVVWKVSDTARAVLDIDNYEQYVPIQAESALRHLANQYSYDHIEDEEGALTLRAGGDEIISKLKHELQERFEKAGLRIEDARLTHLAYAPEIAGAMLRRQQAEAIIGARKQIVLGAVSSERASTTLVRIALNCGPRGSISPVLDPRIGMSSPLSWAWLATATTGSWWRAA